LVGRDFKKLPLTVVEENAAGVLFSGAPARVLGSKYTYGNVGGSIVGIP
jgi:Iap family predicted aminopeptidase